MLTSKQLLNLADYLDNASNEQLLNILLDVQYELDNRETDF